MPLQVSYPQQQHLLVILLLEYNYYKLILFVYNLFKLQQVFFFIYYIFFSFFYKGIKFFIIAEPNATNLEQLLKSVYEIYTDYVLKVNN